MEVRNLNYYQNPSFRSKVVKTDLLQNVITTIDKEMKSPHYLSLIEKKIILSLEALLNDGKNRTIELLPDFGKTSNSIKILSNGEFIAGIEGKMSYLDLLSQILPMLSGDNIGTKLLPQIEKKFLEIQHFTKRIKLSKNYLENLRSLASKYRIDNSLDIAKETKELDKLKQKKDQLFKEMDLLRKKDKLDLKKRLEEIKSKL